MHLPRQNWGAMMVQTDQAMNDGVDLALKEITPAITFLKRLYSKYPAIQSGILITEHLIFPGNAACITSFLFTTPQLVEQFSSALEELQSR
jgi:hypothetical protein